MQHPFGKVALLGSTRIQRYSPSRQEDDDMALALSPQQTPRSAAPALRPRTAGSGSSTAALRLSVECRTRRNQDIRDRYLAAERARRMSVYRRRRIVVAIMSLTIAAVACLGVRAMASRGDGAASLPTATPQGSAVLSSAVAQDGVSLPVADLTSAFALTDQMYVVQPGDTLWSIASSLTDGSIRSYVSQLIDLNGGASISVGQRLVLPED